MSTPYHQPTLNLWGVLLESKRIITAHSRHFLALSVFFLLPLSFSLIIFPTIQSQSLPLINRYPTEQSLFFYGKYDLNKDEIFIPFIYSLFVLLLSLVSVATITYSTFHGFYGRPVKLASSFKSVVYSFLPLLATFIFSQVIMSLAILSFALLAVILYKGLLTLGLEISLESNYFMGSVFLLGVVVLVSLIWLQVNWSLGTVVVVVESKWGYEPLRRSRYLLNGMRGVALSMLLFYGLAIGFLVWGCSISVANAGEASGWLSWAFVVQIVVSSGFMTLLMLHNVASNVVLYMYCRALHGELALEIAEEFAREYVSLPFDYEKVPHVVSVVQV